MGVGPPVGGLSRTSCPAASSNARPSPGPWPWSPEVLLLDEPTSALDDARAGRLAELLRRLVTDGLALVTVTHDADFARRLGGRVYRLEDGHLSGPSGAGQGT